MSFDMQPIPPELPNKEKLALYFWAIAYFVLGLAFTIMTWLLIFRHKPGLAFISGASSWGCFILSNKRIDEFRFYKDIENE